MLVPCLVPVEVLYWRAWPSLFSFLTVFLACFVPLYSMSGPGNFALDGGDPRQEKNPLQYGLDNGNKEVYDTQVGHVNDTGFSVEAAQIHNDKSILFEEYLHYASITRAAEHHYEGNRINTKEPWSLGGVIKNRFSKGDKYTPEAGQVVGTKHGDFSTVTDEEWRTASRATRTASWGTIFFLITTDILGPSGAPLVQRSGLAASVY